MKKSHKITFEKTIALIIFALIASFFLVEMLMKPISGEDIFQQRHMSSSGWSGTGQTIAITIEVIPRIGQVFHHLVIWQFHNIPTLGFETIIRLLDAVMAFSIIYIISMMALGGKKLRLRYKDSAAAAVSFIILILSPFTEMFFKGFSNVHNYVPAVFFALLFGYFWFWKDKLQKRLDRGWFNALFLLFGFLFASATEISSFAFTLTATMFALWQLIYHKQKIKTILTQSKDYLFGILGIISGFIFIFIIGNSTATTIDRANDGYMGSSSINSLLSNPIKVLPELTANFIHNAYSYLPFILLAITGTVVFYQLVLKKHPKNQQLICYSHYLSLVTPVIFSIFYISLCSFVIYVTQRLTVVAFCSLLIPITYLLTSLISYLKNTKILNTIFLFSTLLITAMIIDNFIFLQRTLNATQEALISIENNNCLDANAVAQANIPQTSKIFRFPHTESPFAYTQTFYYTTYYPINGREIPIRENCNE
ncbi:MAG: hypothetical protein LBT19_00715 [Candidatus Nomurabacteria bacterium]|jgi:hypothetical protein|nr:hypothetical protein [Candidatus Nomurabacteria bacterium]